MPHWGADDVRIIGDLLVGRLLIDLAARAAMRFGLLAVGKGALEPGAAWVWHQGYRLADRAAGGRLPDQPWAKAADAEQAAAQQEPSASPRD